MARPLFPVHDSRRDGLIALIATAAAVGVAFFLKETAAVFMP